MQKKYLFLLLICSLVAPLHAIYDPQDTYYEKPNTQEEFVERVKQAHALSKDLRAIHHPKPFARLTRVVDAGIKTWWEKKWEQYWGYVIGVPIALVVLCAIASSPR